MPLSASYPFGNRDVAMSGITTPAPMAKPIGSTILSGVNDVVGLFQNMGQQGVRRAQAGYYGAESERARAEAYKAQTEGEAKAAGISRQQAKDAALADGEKAYQETLDRTGNVVQAAQARQRIVAPYYADEFAEKGLTSQLATDTMLSGTDPTGTGQISPVMRAARNVTAGALAINDRALKGPEGTTQLTYDDSMAALAADEQRQRDKALQESADRRYGVGVESSDRRYGIGVESGDRRNATATEARTSLANNLTTNYREAYGSSLGQIRAAGGDPRLPGGGVPVNKTAVADKKEVITGRKGELLRTTETTNTPARVPGLPQGPAYPPGPAGPSLSGSAGAPAVPSKAQWLAAAQKANPGAGPGELSAYYDNKYGKK